MAPILGIWASALQGSSTAGSFDSIATVTVGSGGASLITFSSIPQTYTHLQLRYYAQKTTNGSAYLRFNNNTTAAYSEYAFGSENGNKWLDGQSGNIGGADIQCGNTSGNFAAGIIDIFNYTDTNNYKSIACHTGRDNNGSGIVFMKTAVYRANTNAITNLYIVPDSTNIVQNSSYALYGIK